MGQEEFSSRVAELRQRKGVSAREMSLACELSESYVNNIENQRNMPSISTFFRICSYLNITARDFFDYEVEAPEKLSELLRLGRKLTDSQLDAVLAVARSMAESNDKK